MSINDVRVVINLTQPVRKEGFGYPLILESGVETAKEYAEYLSLAEIVKAGYTEQSYVYALANAIFMQTNAPKKIAVCSTVDTALVWLQNELNTQKEWRQLILASDLEEAEISGVADYIETLNGKLFFVAYEKDGASSITGKKRTIYVTATAEDNNVSHAALVGESAGRTVGSFTYKNLVIGGVTPLDVTSQEIKGYNEANVNAIVKKAGKVVTSDGVTTSGEYIDIVDSEDFVIHQITYRVQNLLVNSAKIPYTNGGIAMLENVVVSVLQECYNNGMIAENEDGSPAYTVNFDLRENTPEENIATRQYLGGKFKFKLAGAIHAVEITGEISL